MSAPSGQFSRRSRISDVYCSWMVAQADVLDVVDVVDVLDVISCCSPAGF